MVQRLGCIARAAPNEPICSIDIAGAGPGIGVILERSLIVAERELSITVVLLAINSQLSLLLIIMHV